MGRTKEITIPGRYDKIGEACEFVAVGAEEAGFGVDELFRIELACDEACTNIIEHAYGKEDAGDITVSWRVTADAFVITMRDNGRPFDPTDVPEPSIPSDPADIDNLKIGGLGIHFMRKLMDEVHFFADKVHGNRLVMVKSRPSS